MLLVACLRESIAILNIAGDRDSMLESIGLTINLISTSKLEQYPEFNITRKHILQVEIRDIRHSVGKLV